MVDPASTEEEAIWENIVPGKDCHVLAGAHKAQADVLITLDRQHILVARVRESFPIPIQGTTEFFLGFSE